MASVIKKPNGHRWVQFNFGRKRPVLRLGRVSKQQAEHVRTNIERMISEIAIGQISPQSRAWVQSLSPEIKRKLADFGLLEKQISHRLDDYLEHVFSRFDVKESTLKSYEHVRRNLLNFFPPDRPISSITHGDAEDFRSWLAQHEKLAPATVSRRVRRAGEFFNVAIKKRWLEDNPFYGFKGFVETNENRKEFIDRETIDSVMRFCSPEWQLILALCRFGGLRCPSEVMPLCWHHVDWEEGIIHVQSPKTERYAGRESRRVPIFPELKPHLLHAWETAPECTQYVIQSRSTGNGLTNQLGRILKRANVQQWNKLFHNLRASRQTELENEYPTHVVCAWIGNSPKVARRHYLQVTKEHLARAIGGAAKSAATDLNNTPNDAKSAALKSATFDASDASKHCF